MKIIEININQYERLLNKNENKMNKFKKIIILSKFSSKNMKN